MDGSSAKFSIFPTRRFSNALWWKQLGGTGATRFMYDFYAYVKNPGVSQALEFDVNQASGGKRHIFGTECDMQGAHTWRVFGSGHWNSTGVRCSLNSYAWNHVVWEFSRLNGKTNFVSVTVNGAKHYINKSYRASSSGSDELNVAVQLDGIGSPTSYSLWTDRMSLTAF